jgi:hypothetical protein
MRAGLGRVLPGVIVRDRLAGHGSIAFIGHTVTLAGMVVTMLDLMGAALKRRPVEAKPTRKGGTR